MDCIFSELKEVDDHSMIQYVSESISKQEIHSLYESFCKQEEIFFSEEVKEDDEMSTYKFGMLRIRRFVLGSIYDTRR